MVTGFNNYYGNTYYFNEDQTSSEYGAMTFDNVVFNGIEYVVSKQEGNVIAVMLSATRSNTSISDIYSDWYVSPMTASRSYLIHSRGKAVPIVGKVLIHGLLYIFNEVGYLQTEIVKYRDNYYYAHTGVNDIGIVTSMGLYVDGQVLLFGNDGALINKDIISSIQNFTYKEVKCEVGIALAK